MSVNADALVSLAKEAHVWAKAYTSLVEALMREGVPEDVAREEARDAANYAAFFPSEEDPS